MVSTKIKRMVAGGMVALAAVAMVGGGVMGGRAFADNACPDIYGANKTYKNSVAECSTQDGDEPNGGLWNTINLIINVALGMAGIVTVVMIIYGGFRIATAGGAADKVKSGKDTIMYGIIGLIITLLSFAIVNFVLSSVFGGGSGGKSGGGNTTYSRKAVCESANKNNSCTCAPNNDNKFVCK